MANLCTTVIYTPLISELSFEIAKSPQFNNELSATMRLALDTGFKGLELDHKKVQTKTPSPHYKYCDSNNLNNRLLESKLTI